MSGLIARRWQAKVLSADLQPWLDTFRDRAFPRMRAIDGWLGITVHCEREGDPCAVTVTTTWEDEAALRRYSGETKRAVMPDFMEPFFVEYDAEATFHDEYFQEVRR